MRHPPGVCYDNIQRENSCLAKSQVKVKYDDNSVCLGLVLAVESSDAASDALIDRLCHLLKGKTILDTLNHLCHRGLDTLHALLHGRDEIADVALPSWGPLVCLIGKTLLSARHDKI